MPQILYCAAGLGDKECLMVAEDSCWPSDCLTPQRVHDELQSRGKALWLAALSPPKTHRHTVGNATCSALAVAGSKCFCGDNVFWQDVDTLFKTSDKNTSTDAVFQWSGWVRSILCIHSWAPLCRTTYYLRTYYLLPTTYCLLPTACYLLPATY